MTDLNTDTDKLLQHLAKQVQIPCSSFKLSVLEQLRYEAFKLRHKKCHKGTTIQFIPTGIGNRVVVACKQCGRKLDITDVGSW